MTIDNSIKLVESCVKGDLETLKTFLKEGELATLFQSSFNCAPSKESKTLLMVAAEYGHLEIVSYLLTSSEISEHAQINQTLLPRHYSALTYAAIAGQTHIVDYLLTSPELKEHATLIQAYEKSPSLLALVSTYDRLDTFEYLLQSSLALNINEVDTYFKETPFQYAFKKGENFLSLVMAHPEFEAKAEYLTWLDERNNMAEFEPELDAYAQGVKAQLNILLQHQHLQKKLSVSESYLPKNKI